MYRRSALVLALLLQVIGCKKAAPIDQCPPGTVERRGSCLVACAGPQDCLSIESCDLSIGACVPGGGNDDAGSKPDAAPRPDADPGPDVIDPFDAGEEDAGMPGALKIQPEQINYGVRASGCGASTVELLVLNEAGDRITITNVYLAPGSDPSFEVERINLPHRLDAGESVNITVRHRALGGGDQIGAVIIETEAEQLTIPLSARTIDRDQREAFNQVPGLIDIAFFIDVSGSGAEPQDALASQVWRLLETLHSQGYSYQIAVAPSVTSGQPGPTFVGRPLYIDNNTTDPERVLAERVRLGSSAQNTPTLLDAALAALLPPRINNEHAGFLRPDSSELNIFVSIPDDSSQSRPQDYTFALENVLGAGNEQHTLSNAITRSSNGIGLCGQLGASTRLEYVATNSGGVVSEVCSNDYSAALTTLPEPRTTRETSFGLSAPAESQTIAVFVNSVEQAPDTWFYDGASNAVLFSAAPPFSSLIEVGYRVACN